MALFLQHFKQNPHPLKKGAASPFEAYLMPHSSNGKHSAVKIHVHVCACDLALAVTSKPKQLIHLESKRLFSFFLFLLHLLHWCVLVITRHILLTMNKNQLCNDKNTPHKTRENQVLLIGCNLRSD